MKKIKKHFLLSVSRDSTNYYGVRFLSYFFQDKNDILVDILNLSRGSLGSGYFSGAAPGKTAAADEQSFLEQIRQKMMDFGFPGQNLRTESRQTSVSTATDIIAYSRKGLYDALVLGRRGLTLLESLIQDSVSSKILDEQCDIPVWICKAPERQKKHVLLCADGSRESLNTADHVGFVLEGTPDKEITVLNVRSRGSRDNQQDIFERTIAQITDNHFPAGRIRTLSLEGEDTAGIILECARESKAAVIAMGRKCQAAPRTGLGRFFVGSVSGEVLNKMEGASLWICK